MARPTVKRRVAATWPLRPTVRYSTQVASALRTETIGGVVMLLAAIAALVWANTPWAGAYEDLRTFEISPHWLHIGHLDVQHWASSGLLAVFFYIAGLELREELTYGELRRPRDAALPVIAAGAGVVAPALIFLAVSAGEPGALGGWAVPTATDIAFALAVLAVTFTSCPAPLRAFLLTLAVVDDLIAIAVIALFYTDTLHWTPLALSVALIGAYGLLQYKGVRSPWVYVPIAVLAWYCLQRSGIHATVAGIALGMLTSPRETSDGRPTNAERADHALRPFSAGVAVPVFAFVSAGVGLGMSELGAVFTDRVALGVIAGLVIGKFVGVFGGAWAAVRLGLATLGEDLHWHEIAGVALLAGVGFTVSLLIGGLAYTDPSQFERVTTAVLIASVLASAAAAVVFRRRVRLRARPD
ncbi:Na+/H+ antiporter NhaA [Actinomadura madurae]|uniref:Na+/H+ antiporter NhaA n=1 Tax=Actinomadura madurae TaxID=1993 RepID=UPI00202737BE|nr:Na+/H+ antiporter NhaA [Actinomadura madurae]MCP9952360.1 Na+/H+ antiporter NhaA [Actinomadura madurae]MCP9969127.1 Na+/H+ antiporter NhaA [Actinomadura madurae]MCP9981600.1 Na+/H+ antiporter NhaA [Actinomadura madurae]MCQ0017800.1 Na+/H+ antiporter NhaA [Actinomadura madurae]URM97884.1 Na+/H+ antiporter NhaA [Actinomadura madurae]